LAEGAPPMPSWPTWVAIGVGVPAMFVLMLLIGRSARAHLAAEAGTDVL